MSTFWKILWVIVLILNVLAGIAATFLGKGGSAVAHLGIAVALFLIYLYLKD